MKVVLLLDDNRREWLTDWDNVEVWRLMAGIRGPHTMGRIEVPENVAPAARSPRPAATKALEFLLELDDRGELRR